MLEEQELLQRLTQDPDLGNGKVRIKDTRLTVELLLNQLSQGASYAELLADYPELEIADLYAVLACAKQAVQQEGRRPDQAPEPRQE